jgi:hypothetical protein
MKRLIKVVAVLLILATTGCIAAAGYWYSIQPKRDRAAYENFTYSTLVYWSPIEEARETYVDGNYFCYDGLLFWETGRFGLVIPKQDSYGYAYRCGYSNNMFENRELPKGYKQET